MSVLGLLSPFNNFVSFDKHRIDNLAFRLATKTTTLIFLVSCALVTASTFIGDPIDCVVTGVPAGVMDTYCWIHSTFTLPRRVRGISEGVVAHPGVGAPDFDYDEGEGGENITRHRYYQWVCFTLFFQACVSYLPRYLWLAGEGKRMSSLVPDALVYSVSDKRMPAFAVPAGAVSEDVVKDRVNHMAQYLAAHLRGGKDLRNYFWRFIACEILNVVVVLFQLWFTDNFLGGMFLGFAGTLAEAANLDPEDRFDPMALVFPKVAKCTFRRYGPTGTIERFDGLCVLPVNIINEKIYIFLWYWLVILAVVSCVAVLYRAITLCSRAARKAKLRSRASHLVDAATVERITDGRAASGWFFLSQLGANLDPRIFSWLLYELDKLLLMPVPNGHGGKDSLEEKTEKMA